ncbi:MAG: hypothetical protein JW725_04620 [Candidatus Babeliaceae bacterium]|nr:hypothetical protein [Candidatus Babeliaceae bacterium]
MIAFNALDLVLKSVWFVFSRPFLWGLLAVGALGGAFFGLWDELVAPTFWGSEYLLVLVQSFFDIWWYLLVTTVIIADIRGEQRFVHSFFWHSLVRTASAWWLIAWITLLRWALIPLLKTPCCYNEPIDLTLFSILCVLFGLQHVLNFFIMPPLVLGEDNILSLYGYAFIELKKCWASLMAFFILVAGPWAIVFCLIGYLCSSIRSLTSPLFGLSQEPIVSKMLMKSLSTAFAALVVSVGRVMFYESQKSQQKG